jgi:hypothetical protein
MDEYVQAVLRQAVYEMDSDGSAFGSVVVVPGISVSANGKTYNQCVSALQRNVCREVEHALHVNLPLPVVNGVLPPR